MNENERLRKRLVLKEIIEWLTISISCLKDMRTLRTIDINKGTFECNTHQQMNTKTNNLNLRQEVQNKRPDLKEV